MVSRVTPPKVSARILNEAKAAEDEATPPLRERKVNNGCQLTVKARGELFAALVSAAPLMDWAILTVPSPRSTPKSSTTSPSTGDAPRLVSVYPRPSPQVTRYGPPRPVTLISNEPAPPTS